MACVNSFLWIYTIERVELILARDLTPYQLENHALVVILSIESMVSIHSLQLYCYQTPTEDTCDFCFGTHDNLQQPPS